PIDRVHLTRVKCHTVSDLRSPPRQKRADREGKVTRADYHLSAGHKPTRGQRKIAGISRGAPCRQYHWRTRQPKAKDSAIRKRKHGLLERSEEHTSELQSLAYLVC